LNILAMVEEFHPHASLTFFSLLLILLSVPFQLLHNDRKHVDVLLFKYCLKKVSIWCLALTCFCLFCMSKCRNFPLFWKHDQMLAFFFQTVMCQSVFFQAMQMLLFYLNQWLLFKEYKGWFTVFCNSFLLHLYFGRF